MNGAEVGRIRDVEIDGDKKFPIQVLIIFGKLQNKA